MRYTDSVKIQHWDKNHLYDLYNNKNNLICIIKRLDKENKWKYRKCTRACGLSSKLLHRPATCDNKDTDLRWKSMINELCVAATISTQLLIILKYTSMGGSHRLSFAIARRAPCNLHLTWQSNYTIRIRRNIRTANVLVSSYWRYLLDAPFFLDIYRLKLPSWNHLSRIAAHPEPLFTEGCQNSHGTADTKIHERLSSRPAI